VGAITARACVEGSRVRQATISSRKARTTTQCLINRGMTNAARLAADTLHLTSHLSNVRRGSRAEFWLSHGVVCA